MAKQVRYVSNEPVHLGESGYYKPGEVFVTDADPLDNWKKVDADEAAAITGADPLKHEDVNIDELDVPALKALAASKGLNVGNAKTADALKQIIRAGNEPAL